MLTQGAEKYSADAYAPGGTIIDTNSKFNVKTEFVTTSDYSEFWKLRTRITQDGREMMMEADCRNSLRYLTSDLSGGLGLIFSNWDNTKGYYANFEPSDKCPAPAETCENAQVQLEDMKLWTSGYTEDPIVNF